MQKMIYALILIIFIGLAGYIFVLPLSHSKEGRVKIAMGGRSTMELWFKHWNWPYPLRVKGTYMSWPIPYYKFAHENLYLEYLPLDGPKSKDPSVPFGEKMLKSFEAGLNNGKYDAGFFKFCYVDFPVKEEEWDKKYKGLTKTIMAAHEITSKRKIKLIIGNALPLLKPSESTLRLQREYNKWLQEFKAKHDDVCIFDFFGILSDQNGRLKMELARDENDGHPDDQAFSVLDSIFFKDVSRWVRK